MLECTDRRGSFGFPVYVTIGQQESRDVGILGDRQASTLHKADVFLHTVQTSFGVRGVLGDLDHVLGPVDEVGVGVDMAVDGPFQQLVLDVGIVGYDDDIPVPKEEIIYDIAVSMARDPRSIKDRAS